MKTFSDYRELREFVAAQCTRKEWQSKLFKQKEMIEEIIWEYEQERKNKGEIKMQINTTDYPSSHEFLKSYLIVERKNITSYDVRQMHVQKMLKVDFKKWRGWRNLSGSEACRLDPER